MKSRLLILGITLLAMHHSQTVMAQTLLGGQLQDTDIVHEYVQPTRVMWQTEASVTHAENLLKDFSGQVSVTQQDCCLFSTKKGGECSVLLDFGREMHGCLQIVSAIRDVNQPARFRVRLGESVSEAMSDVASSNATNDHAMRDMLVEVPWLGSVCTSNTGFRFARIDLQEDTVDVPIAAIRAVAQYRNIEYKGSFSCSDSRLNAIWQTGAYTVHMNMQDFVWDGIKRDRLVWIGDMHPEVMTINSVFGWQPVVGKSLDFARDDTPLANTTGESRQASSYDDFIDMLKTTPHWMNNMCSYSLWWIIIQRDLYLYQGQVNYLRQQQDYLSQLLRQVLTHTDDKKEQLSGGIRFLDWPTSERPNVIHAGLQALTIMALEAGSELLDVLGDSQLSNECRDKVRELRQYAPFHENSKQAAALLTLAGLLPPSQGADIIRKGGAEGFSTFFGYYMLEALAKAGCYDEALNIISDYWGGMLDLGATTFWEDFSYHDLQRAACIDDFVPAGSYDIHQDGGAYCYVGMRLSLCHGWASGPTPWLSRHVLGIEPLEPGCRKVRVAPHLGRLQWAEGDFPTPLGTIHVRHERTSGGDIKSTIDAPEGIQIINNN